MPSPAAASTTPPTRRTRPRPARARLQAFFEYQTLICQLTGLDVANASLYDGGIAVAEAVLMAHRASPAATGKVLDRRERASGISADARPPISRTSKCRVRHAADAGRLPRIPDDVQKRPTIRRSCVVVQHPNFFGHLEEVEAIGDDRARQSGALFIVSFDPISRRPAETARRVRGRHRRRRGAVPRHADGYGGPYLGILACREEFVRKIPGRLVGQTVDRNGKRCWVLTLQTREQHIRREKATSNICTNQGLLALRAAVYLTALGPQGLKETAELCLRKAHYAADAVAQDAGREVEVRSAVLQGIHDSAYQSDVTSLVKNLRTAGYHAGLPIGRCYPSLTDCVTLAVTEKRTKPEIDGLVLA